MGIFDKDKKDNAERQYRPEPPPITAADPEPPEADPPDEEKPMPMGVEFDFGPSKWDLAKQWRDGGYTHKTEHGESNIPLCPQIQAIGLFVGIIFLAAGQKARITSLIRYGDPLYHGKGHAIDFGLIGIPETIIPKLIDGLMNLRSINARWQFEVEYKKTDVGRVPDHIHCEYDDGSVQARAKSVAAAKSTVAATTTENLGR